MIFTGRYVKIPESRCKCGELIDRAEVVITLKGNRENPTEYAWACPECQAVEAFTATGRDDAIATRLAARSVTHPDGSKTCTTAELQRRIG